MKASRIDIHVAAAGGLSVYLPLYWLATTLRDACGNPEPLTLLQVVVLLLVLAAYLLAPFVVRLLSRHPLAAGIPSWLSVPAVGSALLVLGVVAFGARGPALTLFQAAAAWLALSLWTMPASAGIYWMLARSSARLTGGTASRAAAR